MAIQQATKISIVEGEPAFTKAVIVLSSDSGTKLHIGTTVGVNDAARLEELRNFLAAAFGLTIV